MTWWQTILNNMGHILTGVVTGAVSGGAMYLTGIGGTGQGFNEQQLLIALALGAAGAFLGKNGAQTSQIADLQNQLDTHNQALKDANILPKQ